MSSLPDAKFLDARTPPHLATLVLFSGIGALSMNIFLPSLPGMAAYFDAPYRMVQLSVSLYLAMNAGLQILIGPISDRYGRRPVMMWSIVLFLLATTGTLLAQDIHVFLAFRMCQAVIVAGLVLSRAAIRDMVPADQAASMIGYVTMGMALVPMLAPALGGQLDVLFGWQANFWLLLVLGIALLWLTWRDMGETATRLSGGLVSQIREYPQLLVSPRFWGYCLCAMFASGSFFSFLGGAPFVASEIYGMDEATTGFYFGAPAVGYLVGNYLSGRFATRLGMPKMILIGATVPTIGLAIALSLFLVGDTSHWVFFGFMTIVGLGNGLVLPSANAGMLSVRPSLAGSASGLGGALTLAGGAALSAFAGTLLSVESGALPLIILMFACTVLSLASTFIVRIRERTL